MNSRVRSPSALVSEVVAAMPFAAVGLRVACSSGMDSILVEMEILTESRALGIDHEFIPVEISRAHTPEENIRAVLTEKALELVGCVLNSGVST